MPATGGAISAPGRYAIRQEIGAGGAATVHLGVRLGPAGFFRPVAIKRLHRGLARDSLRLRDEARIAARISHPNVVQTLDLVAADGELLLVMEYVHGESLARLIGAASRRAQRPPLPVVSAVLVHVLRGLHAAHEGRGGGGAPLELVHRDVSPHNVLVGTDGVARVLDFGIARAAGRLATTQEGMVKGKLAYMAPEQIEGVTSRATDIYAAGVCLWETLTTAHLFEGDSDTVVLGRVLAGVIRPPSALVPGLPPALDALTLRALARDPARRFGSALEMASALEQVVVPAGPAAVGDWVEQLAAPALAVRRRWLAELESEGSDGSAGEPAPAEEAPTAPPSRRGWFAVAGLAVLLAALVGLERAASSPPPTSATRVTASAAAHPAPQDSDDRMTGSAAAARGGPGPASGVSLPPMIAPAGGRSAAPSAPRPPGPAAAAIPRPPGPAAAAPPSRRRTAAASKAGRAPTTPDPDCLVHYTIDANGIRRYKEACLRPGPARPAAAGTP